MLSLIRSFSCAIVVDFSVFLRVSLCPSMAGETMCKVRRLASPWTGDSVGSRLAIDLLWECVVEQC